MVFWFIAFPLTLFAAFLGLMGCYVVIGFFILSMVVLLEIALRVYLTLGCKYVSIKMTDFVEKVLTWIEKISMIYFVPLTKFL